MAIRKFNPHSRREERALQAWLVLIGRAHNEQLVRYRDLGLTMYRRKSAGVMNTTLGCVAFYCQRNKLPILTALVVNDRGEPGLGIPMPLARVNLERRFVFEYPWYTIWPPTPNQLDGALEWGRARARAASRSARGAGSGTVVARVRRARP